ncbi:3-keto-5-aminohexanoate cleavage protein, partial [Vibrio campbellii]
GGFENNHLSSDGQLAKNNAEQVQRLKEICELLGVPLHDAESFRESI